MKRFLKTLCLLLLVSFFQSSFAQEYNPLPPQLTQLYTYQQNGSPSAWFFAAHLDSVVAEGADSASYLYRIIRRPQPTDTIVDCNGGAVGNSISPYLLSQDHYFGEKMVRSSTGLCRFISSSGSVFEIESKAAVGASWIFNASITASIDSIVYAPVLGQMDSVKYINLSDGRQLQLSQHYGFVRSFPFLPYYTNGVLDSPVFTLWGIPEMGIGEHLPTVGEIYNFDIGDKVQMYKRTNPTIGSWLVEKYVETIYGQVIPGSVLRYNVTRESIELFTTPPSPTTNYIPATAGTWTLNSSNAAKLSYLPFETPISTVEGLTTGIQVGVHRSIHNGRIAFDFYASDIYDPCGNFISEFERSDQFTYTEGLGLTYRGHWDETESVVNYLLCYAKGTETFGNCRNLSSLNSAQDGLEGAVQLYPNPVDNRLRVAIKDELNFEASNVRVIGLDGRIHYSSEIEIGSNEIEIPSSGFSQGIYLLQIEKEGYQPFSQRFVVQH